MKPLVFWLSLLSAALLTGCGNEYPLTNNSASSDTSDLNGSAADTFVWKGEKTLSSRTIPASAAYWCAPGTQLLLADNATIKVKGSLILSGTVDSPVRIFCPSTATISIEGKVKAAHLMSSGNGGTLFTGAGGSCVLDNIEVDGFTAAIGGYFTSVNIRNATFQDNGAVVSLASIGDLTSSNILTNLTLSGVRITGSGRQTDIGLSLNGTIAAHANVLLQQMLMSNLKSAVSYNVSTSNVFFTAVNVTVKNCIDGFAPLTSQSLGFDTIVVSNSDISTREPAISLGAAQNVNLLVVENSNVYSKAESPMKIAYVPTTMVKIDQAALINKTGKAYSVATQVYDNIVDNRQIVALVLDTAAIAGRGMGYDFTAVDTSTDTGNTTTPSLPAIPFITGAVAGDSSATVTWMKSAYAKSYILYYAAGETVDETGSMIADTGLSILIPGLAPGRNYTIAIRSVNSAGKSNFSSPVTVKPMTKPSAPTIAVATASDGAVTITWNGTLFAESYNLYFQKGVSADGSSAKFTSVTSPKTVSGLTNGVQYAFALSAINSRGESDLSAVDTVIPMGTLSAPVISAATAADGSVSLSWATVTDATSYNVYYAAGQAVSKNDAKITGVMSPKVISNLANGTQYAFAISAANGSNESALSAVSAATPQPALVAPLAPTGVTAIADNGSVTVNWSPVTGATSYKVYYASGTTVDKTAASFSNALSPKSVSGLSNGTVYAFAVSAIGAGGESNLSQVATAMPITIPGVPAITTITPADSTITITWSAVALATSYNLYYASGTTVNKTGLKLTAVASPITVRALTNGTTYAFAIAAANSNAESGLSAVRTATPGVPPPSAPTGIIAMATDSDEVTIGWNPVSGAVSYNIYYTQGATVDITGTKVANVTAPKVIRPLTTGLPWAFCVTAVNAGGQSPISDVATATPVVLSGPK
jgi:hypothetical protein